MEMRYFWVTDQVRRKQFNVRWHPGAEILADYTSKHHMAQVHKDVRPIFLHCEQSSRFLPRALPPSALRGCVGTGRPPHGVMARLPGTVQITLPQLPRGTPRGAGAA